MQITKKELIEALKEDLLDRMCESFYEWVFEEDSEIQQLLSKRLVHGVLQGISKDFKNSLISEMKTQIVEKFIRENNHYLCTAIKDEVKDTILNKIEVEIKCNK